MEFAAARAEKEVLRMYGKLGGRKTRIDLAIDGYCFTFRLWGHRITIG